MEHISKTRIRQIYWLLSDMASELHQPKERANYHENLKRSAQLQCRFLDRKYKRILLSK